MRATINWFQTASDCCAALLRAVAIGEPFEDDQSHTSMTGVHDGATTEEFRFFGYVFCINDHFRRL